MKIGIVGAGQVGATSAYAMTMRGVGSEIVLVDRKADLAVAQAHDILDATPWAYPVRVRAGEWADLDGASINVLAAGVSRSPERVGWICCRATPISLLRSHGSAGRGTRDHISGGIESVDIMTHMVTVLAGRHGVSSQRVIGSGTILGAVPHAARGTSQISPAYIDARARRAGDSSVALVERRGRRFVSHRRCSSDGRNWERPTAAASISPCAARLCHHPG
jgi:L-lactate dehydrogenase